MSTERRSHERRTPGRRSPEQRSAARRDRGLERRRARFRSLTLGICGVLAVLAVGLGAASMSQGPKLSSAELDAAAAVERAGTRLILRPDQSISTARPHVRVSPAAPVGVTVASDGIAVDFTDPLDYATTYTVEAEVIGASTGTRSTLEYRFTTPDPTVTTLVRHGDDSASDRIVRRPLVAHDADRVVLEAPRIEDYARLGDGVLAVVLDGANHPSIRIASAGGTPTEVWTPPARAIRDLRASPSTGIAGFLLSPADDAAGRAHLYVVDSAHPDRGARAVAGTGGVVLSVLDWAFVPGTSSVVVQTEDQQLSLIDLRSKAAPVPLGQHAELRGFLPGSTRLVVADPTSGSIVDLSTGVTAPVEAAIPDLGPELYPGKLVMLDPRRYVQVYTGYTGTDDGTFRSTLYLVAPGSAKALYRPADPGRIVHDFCLAPDGRYLAVETGPATGRTDGYPVLPGVAGASVDLVRISDGTVVGRAAGFAPDWCR